MKKFLTTFPLLLLLLTPVILLLAFFWGAGKLETLYSNRIGREAELSTRISAVAIRDFLKTSPLVQLPTFVEESLLPLLDRQTRITILEKEGKVLTDSWEEPAKMDNHAGRKEVILFTEQFEAQKKSAQGANNNLPCLSYRRYSTTTHQNMLYCITGFESNDQLYLVRTALSIHTLDKIKWAVRGNLIILSFISVATAFWSGLFLYQRLSQTHDRTRVKQLEKYRRDFLGNLSHEIKTPLTVIRGATEALIDGAWESPDKRHIFMQTLVSHSERLTRLLDDVIALTNIECSPENHSPQFEQLPLAQTVQIAVALCKPNAFQRKMTLNFIDKTNEQEARFVPQLIEQAVVNLVDNAIKYSVEGDTINITVLVVEGQFRIVVADHGRGIPKEHSERIFERFYRIDPSRDRQTGGTGLGLAIVKHIAQLHGGTAFTIPTKEQGATFVITLPILLAR